MSPLREAKVLLGVLREQGLAGKGLVRAFDKWAPKLTSSSRTEVAMVYRAQTGREITDYILTQLADKVVRYYQLPPEADVMRRAVSNSNIPSEAGTLAKRQTGQQNRTCWPAGRPPRPRSHGGSHRGQVSDSLLEPVTDNRSIADGVKCDPTEKRGSAMGVMQRLLDRHDPNLLLTTNEVARLTGFRPKTIRRWVSHKLLNHIRVGNRLRFRLAAVELFLAQREVSK